MSLLAIDIGSSRSKAVLFTSAGRMLAQLSRSYTPQFPRPAFAEMDPQIFLDAVTSLSRTIGALHKEDPVEAVCFSCHGETFIPVHASGAPAGPAILNIDNRASEQAAWYERELGRRHLFAITGQVSHSMYPVAKLLWLKEHEPSLLRSNCRFLSVPSYILSKLGLPPFIDYSLASRYLAFDVRARRWSEELLSLLALPADRLPIPVPAGTVAGALGIGAAREMGLRPGTPVIVGGHDQACGSLGLGITAAGRVSDSMGTYECLTAASESPYLNDEALDASLDSYCHVIPDKFITIAYFPAGIMVQWFHDLLYGARPGAPPRGEGDSSYAELEALAPAEPSGLLVTPHLVGTCNPDFNPLARAAMTGLSRESHRGHIYRGILEGIACELSMLTGIFAKTAGEFSDLYVTGGGTQSPLGMKLRAAATGCSLHSMACREAPCLGAAILASVAVGLYSGIADAVSSMVRETARIEPDARTATSLRDLMPRYLRLRSMLAASEEPASIPPPHRKKGKTL